MEIMTAIKDAPEWVALFVAGAWILWLQRQVNYLQARLERVSDRTDATKDTLIGKLTKTDLKE